MPKVHYSSNTEEGNEPSRGRKETWAGDLSISQRNGVSPNYQRNQTYTFSPNDHHNPENSRIPPSLKQTSPHLLVEGNTRNQAVTRQRRQEPRFSMTNKTRSDMIYKLREMGDEIDVLMRDSTASCRDLTSSLLHLKDLIEDVFVQVSVELQDLKAENYDLKNEGGRADLDQVERLQNHFQNKIISLEEDRNHLQVSLKRIKTALQKGQSANEELSRKSHRSDQIARQTSILQQQQDRNRAVITKLNAKLQQLTRAKDDLRRQASSQDEFLKQIKEEASMAIGSNKDLSRKAIEAESECAELRREMDLLAKKNRQLEGELEYLDEERQKILRQSKMDLTELNDIRAENNNLVKEVQVITERLRHQKNNQEGLRGDLQTHRRELETERRRTGQLKGLHGKYRQDFEQSLNTQRNNLGRRIQEYSDKYSGVDKNLMDQLKKGDYLQSQIGRYQKQLQDQRRKSNLLENEYKGRYQQHNSEKQGILRNIQEQARNGSRQNLEIRSYNQKLTKCEDLLQDFARQSDVNQKGLKGLRKQMEDDRRRSNLVEEESLRKLKALADQNRNLQQRAQQSKQKHSKSLQAMKDYQQRYRQAQMRLGQEARKTDINNNKIKELLAEMDEERRLSQIDVRDKKDLIRKIQEKNQQMSNQISAQREEFKNKQASFFDRNKELEHYLVENGRQSDMLGKELLQLRDQYQNERRRSLAFEQEQQDISTRMKQLGDKYGFVAQKLQESQGMFKNKQAMFNVLEKKYKEVERVFLDQTRKSQLDQDQLKMMRDDIDRERRKSMAFQQESIDKIKGLLSYHNQLNQGLKEQQLRQQQQFELMGRVDERTRLLEGQNRDLARMSDMHQNQINSYKEQLENERRRSMALESQNKERLRAIQSKNLELLEKLDQDRDRIGRNEQTLKQAETKYGKIERILQDERRASQMSKAQFGKLGKLYEDERRKSSAIQQQSGRMIGELVKRNQMIENDTDRLQRELSQNSKTIRTLETKSSNAERSLQQLSRMLDRATAQKERADQVVDRCRQQTRQKEEAVRREKQVREQTFRDLKALEERMNQGQAQLQRVQQSRISLGRQIQERQHLITEGLNNNEHMVEVLNQLKISERSLKIRVDELNKINIENKATFQKNYSILKSEIGYRQQYNSEKTKRIQLLSQQAERDNKRVLAINPTQLLGSRTR